MRNSIAAITRSDRDALAKQLRMNFRVLRHQVDAVEQQRLADFQEQLATEYPSDDPRWESVTAETEKLVRIADRKLKAIFTEYDIPEWARPGLQISWYRRGENAVTSRRVELTKAATTRFKADAAAAKVELDRREAEAHSELIGPSLTSAKAHALLERMPSAEQLMPRITVAEIEAVEEFGQKRRR